MTKDEPKRSNLPVLAITESARKDAERHMEETARRLAESLPDMSGIARSLTEAMAPMAEMLRPKVFSIPARSFAPAPVRLDRDQFNTLIEKVAERAPQAGPKELVYDWNEGGFSRSALGHVFPYRFNGKEDNKRRTLVEKLLPTLKNVRTKNLASLLRCSEKQVSNMVAEINNDFMVALSFKEPLVINDSGKGYRINPALTVFQKK